MPDLEPFGNFEDAARSVLAFLRQHSSFDLWMVTRRHGDDWIILQVDDEGYGVSEGSVFCWADSYCAEMVMGRGPQVAPDASKLQVYADASISSQLEIGAYIGVPLIREDGSLFGTLCAINAEPVSPEIEGQLELVKLMARLLSTLLTNDLKLSNQERSVERSQHETAMDGLTGLRNRRGWEEILQAEEIRSRRYGNPACVLVIALDDLKALNGRNGHAAGDLLLRRAAEALTGSLGEHDMAARVGGDEFSILGIECDSALLYERVQEVLLTHGINASVGLALRDPRHGLLDAWQEATRAMCAVKQARQT